MLRIIGITDADVLAQSMREMIGCCHGDDMLDDTHVRQSCDQQFLLCSFRHYPKTSFTIVTDTPENLRLKQQSMLNSQVRRLSTNLAASLGLAESVASV